jgi:Uma2 family endonuclease
MSSMSKPLTCDEVVYPESDGQPMGETDWHILALRLLLDGLDDRFEDQADVYVGGDLFLYYMEGHPSKNTAPDAMVVKGIAKEKRRTFKTWVEKALPCTVFEITSSDTWQKDLGEKRQLYERLKVAEYFVFDPEARWLLPPLRGFRLRAARYQPLTAAADGSLTSKELGLRLLPDGAMLRLIDDRTGKPIPTRRERAAQAERRAQRASRRAQEQRQRAEQERQRAEALQAELARLRQQGNPRKS